MKIIKKILERGEKIRNAIEQVGSWKDKRVVHKYKDEGEGTVIEDDCRGAVTVLWDGGKKELGVIKDNLKLIPSTL